MTADDVDLTADDVDWARAIVPVDSGPVRVVRAETDDDENGLSLTAAERVAFDKQAEEQGEGTILEYDDGTLDESVGITDDTLAKLLATGLANIRRVTIVRPTASATPSDIAALQLVLSDSEGLGWFG